MSNTKKLFWIFFPLIIIGLIMSLIFGSGTFWLEYITLIIVLVIVSSIFTEYKTFRRVCIYVIVIFFVIFETGKFMKIHWPMTLSGIFEYKTNRDMNNFASLRRPETGTQIMLLKQFGDANKARTVVLKDSVQYYLKKQSFGPLSPDDSTKLAKWIKECARFNKQSKALLDLGGIKEEAQPNDTEATAQARVDTMIVPANSFFPAEIKTDSGDIGITVNDQDLSKGKSPGALFDNSGKYTVFVYHNPDGTIRIEAKGKIVWINWCGYKKECDANGTPLEDIPLKYRQSSRFDFNQQNLVDPKSPFGALVGKNMKTGETFLIGKSKVIG